MYKGYTVRHYMYTPHFNIFYRALQIFGSRQIVYTHTHIIVQYGIFLKKSKIIDTSGHG